MAKGGKKAKTAEGAPLERYKDDGRLHKKFYEAELYRLQGELVKMQEWVRSSGARIVVVFEGRDAAGKGGVIKRISDPLNPRHVRVVALPAPSDRETTQWYFQRYVPHLPAASEVVILDRSWYNRPGVERVMGYATEAEVQEFFRDCPEFERMLIRSGIILVKYWFSVSDEEQDRRFQARIDNPMKYWKFSDMDLEGRDRWEEYSHAKDEMFKYTDTKDSPWWVVNGDDKKKARLNCISHLLSLVPYEEIPHERYELPPRKPETNKYMRPPIDSQTFVPEVY